MPTCAPPATARSACCAPRPTRWSALLPAGKRPPALMMSLHVWSMAHGIASLFGRGDAGRRSLPMSAEELLESEMLIYLQGLGFPQKA